MSLHEGAIGMAALRQYAYSWK